MKIHKTIIISLLILSPLIGFGQHKEISVELNKLELRNDNFNTVLDSLVKHEKVCNYYSTELLFTIDIHKTFDNASILIESIDDKNIAFDLDPNGFFYYDKHLFLVIGDKLNSIFIESQIKKTFEYLEYDIFYKEYDSKERRILRIIHDDSFSQWEFLYDTENLILINKSTTCE
ncbi:hypothetical protein [Marixanthomonas ophiurae]|uniref:Uncharacterized protein n=1 Tax=Marixanthomonas ophiurae TaxID=387659 RepID=A0A3E1QBX1_9FLAO|nr:hypothetical protein [Marixanthomonas ophiurae]RFN59606.1 hypothetical protein DZ858_05980 [Marixanthomonas ophiurae]